MNEAAFKRLLHENYIRKRSPDFQRAESLIHSAIADASAAVARPLDTIQAPLIFRSLYEAFRKLGDAWWWRKGYQLQKNWHELSLKALSAADISSSHTLGNLDHFRRIRNDNEYDGYLIKVAEAKEILELWTATSQDIIDWIRKEGVQ